MPVKKKKSGGGSGGGSEAAHGMDDKGNNLQSCKRTYQIAGNQVVLLSRKSLGLPDAGSPGPSNITLLAAGGPPTFDDDGEIDIRGTKVVRVTSGGFAIPLMNPAATTNSKSFQGVVVEVGALQSVLIKQSDLTGARSFRLDQDGLTVDVGIAGTLTLQSGPSKIVLDALGITIQGPIVQINPPAPIGPGDFPEPDPDSPMA